MYVVHNCCLRLCMCLFFCVYISCPWMYEEESKNPTRSVATENAVGIGAAAQIRRLLHIGGQSGNLRTRDR